MMEHNTRMMGQRFTNHNQKFDTGDCLHYALVVVLDGNLPDELSLMTTYLMNGLLDKGINKM